MAQRRKLTDEVVNGIIRMFPNVTNTEICSEFGISRTTVDRIAKQYGLRKSLDHLHNMGVRAGKASSKARGGRPLGITPEVIARRAETYKERVRKEYVRYNWGLEQITKIKLRKEPRAKHDQRLYLEKRGYIIDNIRLIAYWTENTDRSKRLENRKPDSCFRNYYTFKPYETS